MIFPSWISPEIIPGLPIRWYGLMYIFAFGTAFIMYRKQVKERNFPMSDDSLSSLFFWGILGLLIGARLFSTLIYHGDSTYLKNPWLIFWPFQNGRFTGLQGMSYHGGAFCGLLAVILFSKAKKYSFREIGDMFAAAIPLGFTFGRIGNFINAELYGKITASPLGMVFPEKSTRLLSIHDPKVQEVAEKLGIDLTQTGSSLVNLPRHPSQLYQAFFEGIVLWVIVWSFRNRKPFKGFLVGLYFLGYGVIRFIIEFFREPDAHLGYRFANLTTGQILCLFMIAFGSIWMVAVSSLPDSKPVNAFSEEEQKQAQKEEAARERNQRRKMRKKLK